MSDLLKPIIDKAAQGPLSRQDAETAFNLLFDGDATPSQIGGLLMAMRTRGEAVDEIAAAAAVMRSKCNKVSAPKDAIDIVGTGGDGKKTLNISTATAFVVAGAGVTVAKHGNRNLSSKSGAADALEMSGVQVMVPAAIAEQAINEIGIGFMMAPMHHPAVKHVMPTRLELGTRTIFNILGPLTNPAGVTRQLTGAFSGAMLRPMAETLLALGATTAWLVHGSDGTDEIAISGPTQVVAVENGAIREFEITPEDAGLSRHNFEEIIGGEPAHNAAAMARLFEGETSAYRDAVLLNAAAAIHIASDGAIDLKSAAQKAAQSIDTGAAKAKLDALAKLTSEAANG